jgi:hypothetical protein
VVLETASSFQNHPKLSEKLLEMEGDAEIQDIIMKTCLVASVRSPITSLLSMCHTMQMLTRQEGQARLQGVSALYNKTTCFEFHQLLVATLLSYGKVLNKFVKAMKGKTQPDLQNLVCIADEVWACTTLLWSIVYSHILENHLDILHQNRWLTLPINWGFSVYCDFTTFKHNKNGQEIFTASEEEESWHEGEVVNRLSASGLARGDEGGSFTSDNLVEIACEDVEGGREGEEVCILFADKKLVGLANIYLRWIHLQVDCWQVTHKLLS